MFYAALCDMTLYMYSDENSYKRSTHCSNVIHLHHSLAAKAGDYVKKNHVFRLQTADMAQYLIQTRFLWSIDVFQQCQLGNWKDVAYKIRDTTIPKSSALVPGLT